MTERNEAIHREARASMPAPARPTFAPVVLQMNTQFASVREGAGGLDLGGGPDTVHRQDTVELLQVERERDLPRSRLADALASARGP